MDEEKVTKEIFKLRERETILEDLLNRWLQLCGRDDRPIQTEQLVIDTRNALYGER